MLINASKEKDKFKDYIEKIADSYNVDDDYYYMDYSRYSYIAENLDERIDNYILFLDDKGEIENFAYTENENGITIFSLDNESDIDLLRKNLEEIKENFDLPILYYTNTIARNSDDLELYTFSGERDKGLMIDRMSSVIDESYCFPTEIACLKEEDKERVLEKFDEINFPSIKGDLCFEVLDYQKFVYDKTTASDFIPCQTTEDYNDHLAGFHYLGLVDYKEDSLLVAKDENGTVVGGIKYGVYGEKDTEHIGLCFIDVGKPYRGQGIATSLLEEFGNVIKDYNKENETNLPIYLTDESDMGELCHMKDTAINKMKGVNLYYEDRRAYKYVAYRDGEEIGETRNLKELFEEMKHIGEGPVDFGDVKLEKELEITNKDNSKNDDLEL